MHLSVMVYLRRACRDGLVTSGPTLELGSYETGPMTRIGGPPRKYFDGEYIAADLRPGPGVDVVLEGLQWPDDWEAKFNTILCLNVLEHDKRPWQTVKKIAWGLADGGQVLLSCPGPGMSRHDYPVDYWRFTPEAVRLLLEDAGLTVLDIQPDVEKGGVLCRACKETSDAT